MMDHFYSGHLDPQSVQPDGVGSHHGGVHPTGGVKANQERAEGGQHPGDGPETDPGGDEEPARPQGE